MLNHYLVYGERGLENSSSTQDILLGAVTLHRREDVFLEKKPTANSSGKFIYNGNEYVSIKYVKVEDFYNILLKFQKTNKRKDS